MTFDVEFILNDRTFNVNTEQGAVIPPAASVITKDGTIVSQNADFAEVAEWADGNPNNEDRTGYFVCANVPIDGIVMKKATSLDDVKGVTILAPAFAGNYSKDKLDANGNLLPKYSYVAIIGFVPVIDNGTCTVGGRCMPDDNGCAIPSSNSMGYQVVNRIDENRVLIIIEPNGDMVQRIKTRVNEMQEEISDKADKEEWEKIIDITTAEEITTLIFTKEEFPKILKSKEVLLRVQIPKVATTISLGIFACALSTDASWKTTIYQCPVTAETNTIKEIRAHGYIIDDIVHGVGCCAGQGSVVTTANMLCSGKDSKYVNGAICEVSSGKVFPIGTKFTIYGKVGA